MSRARIVLWALDAVAIAAGVYAIYSARTAGAEGSSTAVVAVFVVAWLWLLGRILVGAFRRSSTLISPTRSWYHRFEGYFLRFGVGLMLVIVLAIGLMVLL